MRLSIKALILLFMSISMLGCDSNQYQIITGSDGALYRFNKKTGELSMVMEDKKVVRLAESQKPDIMDPKNDSPLEKPISWEESRYPGKNLKVKLETVWRENKLCYKFLVYPYKSLEKAFIKKKQDYVYSLMKPGFNVELVDKNGFMVKEIKINLWSMTKVPGEDGNPNLSTKAQGSVLSKAEGPEELLMNSQIDCSKQSYRSIGAYTVKWQLEPELIEDEKSENAVNSSLKGDNR